MTQKRKRHKKVSHSIRTIAAIVIVALFVFVGIVWIFEWVYAGRIYPGVSIGTLYVGGSTSKQAYDILQERIDSFEHLGLVFVHPDRKVVIDTTIQSSENIELAYELLRFDTNEMVSLAYSYGRDGNTFTNFIQQTKAFFLGVDIKPIYTLDDEFLLARLTEEFQDLLVFAKNAKISYAADRGVFIQEEQLGNVLDRESIINELRENLSRFENNPVSIELITDYPDIYTQDLTQVLQEAKQVIELAPVLVIYKENSWEIDKNTLGGWLSIDTTDGLSLSLNREEIEEFFNKIASEVEVEPVNAKFVIRGTKVEEFQSSISGKEIDREESYKNLVHTLIEKGESEVLLVVEEVEPEITNENVNNLGIKEIIGIGKSNFAGSPQNRRHNIAVGAKALNGILIAPDQEFSLVEALGEIDAEHGYLPELVIKQNKTIPEYGGGLCQIGTTIFRAALSSGLKITERRNHSYTVSYYFEDGLPGTDATIYPPHPDVRFINDTPAYILIQTKIEGDELIFEFWGTNDGRVASRTKPEIWDRVSPGPTKIIETTDLEPGDKKCTERAHDGMKASFTYRVEYADGNIFEKEFYSNYKPWQAVCFVGVEEMPDKDEQDTHQDTENKDDNKLNE